MRVASSIRKFHKSPRKYIVTIILGIVVIALGWYSYSKSYLRRGIDYKSVHEKTAITVNGISRTFKDLAFYVAYEESEVEEQAKAYDDENREKYWNLHIDGEFVRVAARNAAIKMAIHDELFYQMAVKEEITLNSKEQQVLEMSQQDFWSDLTDYDKQDMLGVTREDICQQMERIALAEKYQNIYAGLTNYDVSDYIFTADAYDRLLAENEYKINEDVWQNVNFGTITLNH